MRHTFTAWPLYVFSFYSFTMTCFQIVSGQGKEFIEFVAPPLNHIESSSCAGNLSFCEFMHVMSGYSSEDSISQQSSSPSSYYSLSLRSVLEDHLDVPFRAEHAEITYFHMLTSWKSLHNPLFTSNEVSLVDTSLWCLNNISVESNTNV